MTPLALLQLLGAAPVFASRAFLAAFLTAALVRWGTLIPLLGAHEALVALRSSPPWFTSDLALAVLLGLALLEAAATRNLEARRALHEIDPYLKLGAALVIQLGLLDARSAALLQNIGAGAAATPILHAGLAPTHALALLGGLLTFWLALLRKRALDLVLESDEDDDLGLQSVLVPLEELFVLGGAAVFLLLPLLSLGIFGGTVAVLLVADRLAARAQKSRLVACAACAAPLHASAPCCPACGVPREARAIGAFGLPRDTPAPSSHRHALVAAGRCPRCATRLRAGRIQQSCGACGEVTFASAVAVEGFLAHLTARLPRTALVCALLGAFPLVGIVPGVLYYRLTLLGGARRYLPATPGCTTRWLVRALNLLLLSCQWIPVVGAAMLPLLCVSNFAIYRRVLRAEAGHLLPR